MSVPLYQWIDADGATHNLSDLDTVAVELGAVGLGMPPVAFTAEAFGLAGVA